MASFEISVTNVVKIKSFIVIMGTNKKEYDYEFTLVLLGDRDVGKEKLAAKFVDDTYTPSFVKTVGIDYKRKTLEIDNNRIKLTIYFFAGLDKSLPLENAHGILIVYDVTDKASFKKVDFYVQQIEKRASKNVNVLLVGNKCHNTTDKVISFHEGKEKAKKLKIPFFETSTELNMNIDAIFLEITKDILHRLNPKEESLQDNEGDRNNLKNKLQEYKAQLEDLKNQLKQEKTEHELQEHLNKTLTQKIFDFENEKLEQQKKKTQRIDSIYTHLKCRNWMKQPIDPININDFKEIVFKARGCDGLVMEAEIMMDGKKLKVALKMIINLGDSTLQLKRRCANEFEILPEILQLHPNIVRKLGKFIAQPTLEMINHVGESIRDLCYRNDGKIVKSAQFFILEYYDTTLESVIKSLSIQKIKKYSIHLARGLLFLFESNIAHLDIKSNNLMISSYDDLIIVDFGVAGRVRDDGTVDYRKTIGGNSNHLSPEVITARNNSKDLPCRLQYSWELGLIMYEMITGEYPFDTYGLSTPKDVPELDLSSVPVEFHDILTKLICKEEDRISILEAWKILETDFQQDMDFDD